MRRTEAAICSWPPLRGADGDIASSSPRRVHDFSATTETYRPTSAFAAVSSFPQRCLMVPPYANVTRMKRRLNITDPSNATRRPNRLQHRKLPTAHALDCVPALKALGEETRFRIVALLLDRQLGVEEISLALGISEYRTSNHLRVLRLADLLTVEKRGHRHFYGLPDVIKRTDAQNNLVLDLGCCCFEFSQPARRAANATAKASLPKGSLVPFPTHRRS